jgi:hypothetical protein
MKKLIFLISAVLLSAFSYAQFTFGPQIGYASSTLTLNYDSISSAAKSNFVFGAFARFGKKIYLQPEVNWGSSGSSVKFDVGSGTVTEEINIKSIQVPVSLGWKIINLKVVNIRIYGGVTPSFVTNVTITDPSQSNYLVPDNFKNVLWNYQVGAGVDVLFLALNVSWVGGMSNVFANDVSFNGQTLSSKSNIFQVTLGWKIL